MNLCMLIQINETTTIDELQIHDGSERIFFVHGLGCLNCFDGRVFDIVGLLNNDRFRRLLDLVGLLNDDGFQRILDLVGLLNDDGFRRVLDLVRLNDFFNVFGIGQAIEKCNQMRRQAFRQIGQSRIAIEKLSNELLAIVTCIARPAFRIAPAKKCRKGQITIFGFALGRLGKIGKLVDAPDLRRARFPSPKNGFRGIGDDELGRPVQMTHRKTVLDHFEKAVLVVLAVPKALRKLKFGQRAHFKAGVTKRGRRILGLDTLQDDLGRMTEFPHRRCKDDRFGSCSALCGSPVSQLDRLEMSGHLCTPFGRVL